MRSEEVFDVFLSYNHDDKPIVSEINKLLKEEGIGTWFDVDEIKPGDSFIKKMEDGLEHSNSCLAFVGRTGIGPWENQELYAALFFQVERKGFKVIPVLLPNAPGKPKLPLFIRDRKWVDLRQNQIAGLRDLLSAVRGIVQAPFEYSPLIFKVGNTVYEDGLPTRFKANMKNIVGLLIGESLYARKDVFVRELIQNSFDACERRKGDVLNFVPEIIVTIDDEQGIFQVEDNGEGMNPALLRDRFAIIGKSIREEERVLRRTLADEKERLFLIAKFGIGFITVFIASEKIVVSTRYENEKQIDFSIGNIDIPFRFSEKSECGKPVHKVGTTVQLVLHDDYRIGGKHYVDLVESTQRYLRHSPYVRVYHNGNQIVFPDSWNTEDCVNIQTKRVAQSFEIHMGINDGGGKFTASNGGFFVCDNPDPILPYYLPNWIVGEVNFWPGTVDLNLARDAIIANDYSHDVKMELTQLFRDYLVEYIHRSKRSEGGVGKKTRDLVLYYYQVWKENSTRTGTPLLSEDETYELLLDLVHLPFGSSDKRQPLREILNYLRSNEKKQAYSYYHLSAYDSLGIIIRWLKAREELVFEYFTRRVSVYGLKGRIASVSELSVITSLLDRNGIRLIKLDNLPPEKIEGLAYDIQLLPGILRDELERAQERSRLAFVKIPNGDLSFKIQSTLYLNPAHPAFDQLVAKLRKLPRNVLRAYILGLTQQEIGDLLDF